jgi:hypothetical protein
MIDKMRAHAGPWYVLEHLRPFPGVSLERVIKQIHRGLIGETSIVRGPATDYQWRFAVETPGLCRYFGKCWQCHAQVLPGDTYCGHCMTYLSFEKPRLGMGGLGGSTESDGPIELKPIEPSTGADATDSPSRPVPARAPRSVGSQVSESPQTPPTAAGAATSARSTARSAADLDLLRAAIQTAAPRQHLDTGSDAVPRIAGFRATWIAAFMLLAVVIALMAITQRRTENPPRSTTPPTNAVAPARPDPSDATESHP